MGGIAPLPLSAFSYTCSVPCMRCIAHAFLSPNFGAFATPVPWQAMHVDSYTALPSALAAGSLPAGPAAPRLTSATGLMRFAIASGDLASSS